MGAVLKNSSTDANMIKLLLLGDTNVGKTSMIYFFHRSKILQSPLTTIGIDFIPVKDEQNRTFAHIWDTGGLERYKCINRHYYTGANCVMIVYDATHATKNAYEQVWPWYEDLVDMCGPSNVSKIPVLIVGNKKDKLCDAKLDICSSLKPFLASKNKLFAHEFTSAHTGENIDVVFSRLLRDSQRLLSSPLMNKKTKIEIQQQPAPIIHCCY